MYTDMELTGASTSNATNDLRPATQGQSVRPKSTAVRRTQPQWLASAKSRLDDTSLPDPPHNTILTLAGQRQGNRTVTFLDEDEHVSVIPPVNSRSTGHDSTNQGQGTFRNFSPDDAQKMFENMLAKYSHDQTMKAQTAEKQEMQAMKQTLHDLTGSLKSLTSKIELMSLERDHQFQSSPITRVPEYTLSDFSSDLHPPQPQPKVRPVPAPRKSVVLSSAPNPVPAVNIDVDLLKKARRSKPLGDLPKFDGTGDLTVFKLLFQECVELNGWEDDQIITLWLKQCITGAAKECILFEHITDSRSVFERLDSRYGNHLLIQKYTIILENRRKRRDETLSDLANDIRKMVEVVHHDCDQHTRQKMAISNFIRALPSVHIKYELNKDRPATLEEAVQRAATHEVWYGADSPFKTYQGQRSGSAAAPPPVISQATTENNNIQSAQPSGSQTRARRPCKNCGGDHMPYECRPCRHCGGPHFDNRCTSTTQGNGLPIPQQSTRQ